MSGDVVFQGRLFVLAMTWGGGLLLAYDCLRLLRMFVTRRRGVQAAEEVIFWLCASAVLYGLIYSYNSGAVRNYVIFGMAAGMLAYRIFLSSAFISGACLMLRPVRRWARILKTFIKDMGKGLKSALTGVKIKLKSAKHKLHMGHERHVKHERHKKTRKQGD